MFRKSRKSGFSLVELVVVIVIIGILAAIAIPRLSRGSSGALNSAVSADLAMIRNAINLYAAEHNSVYPGSDGTEATFLAQLTTFSDVDGKTQAGKDSTHKFGPYLVGLPACPVGENASGGKAANILFSATTPPTPVTGGGEGWVYNKGTGEFLPNTQTTDDAGKKYNTY